MKTFEDNTVAMILAGGSGTRLYDLTNERAKPAVRFGGKYRIVDAVLSNCKHSKIHKILVVPQYKCQSLIRHIDMGWDIFNPQMGHILEILPPQMRVDDNYYQGTAGAIYQNIYSLRMIKPRYVLVLAADHIYKMDYTDLLNFHVNQEAELTIAITEVPIEVASGSLGVLVLGSNNEIIDFVEKPIVPPEIPGKPGFCYVSMGIYAFKSGSLIKELEEDRTIPASEHDFGKNIIPKMIESGQKVYAYRFADSEGKLSYWRDVGTIEAYYEAQMDLISLDPQFNLYDLDWPLCTFQEPLPPAKINFGASIEASIICEGVVVDDSYIARSIISPSVRIGRNARITDSVILDNVRIGDGAVIHRAIIDKHNIVTAGAVISPDNINYIGSHRLSDSGTIILVPEIQPSWDGI